MKKKLKCISYIIIAIMLLSVFTSCGLGQLSEFTYEENPDGTYSLSGVGPFAGENIVIPKYYNDKLVTGINGNAFGLNTNVVSVTIPDSVSSIHESAFTLCRSLTSINVDENNEHFRSVNGDLYSKDGTVLLRYAGGKQDESFDVPDTVTGIENKAFFACHSLISVTIPRAVTHIGEGAFSSAYMLTDIRVDENNEYYKSVDGNLYSKDGTRILAYACGKASEVFTLPSGVTFIDYRAFADVDDLVSITIPASVTSIGDEAFCGAGKLISINFEGTIEEWNDIEKGADWCYGTAVQDIVCENGSVSIN